ncbi:hypothetical protein [Arcticibacterium luteifluviistationis]|uniref:hypothetical protein n=1 Tax=Arcticibacterium luteifluviistationis TaxID=1784714 RepID=UPI0013A708C3|nr:hypothetical protein [Arcticibacterium luteifluviistationis]
MTKTQENIAQQKQNVNKTQSHLMQKAPEERYINRKQQTKTHLRTRGATCYSR